MIKSSKIILFISFFVLSTFFCYCESSDFITYNYHTANLKDDNTKNKSDADKKAELVQLSCVKAVKNATGRFYFQKRSIIAKSILDKYLDQSYSKFIYDYEVSNLKMVDKNFEADLRVVVDVKKLQEDLESKNFFYRPKISPFALVYLNMIIDNQVAENKEAKNLVYSIFKDRSIRYVELDEQILKSNQDISKSSFLLDGGIQVAQKNSAEILISGTVKVDFKEEKELYYDKYYRYSANVDLKLYRAETSEVISSAVYQYSSSDVDKQTAINEAVNEALTNATKILIDGFYEKWMNQVQPNGNYNLMITNIEEKEIPDFINAFESKSGFGKIYLRTYYGGAANFNIFFDVDRKEIPEVISSIEYPQINIVSFKKTDIEAEIVR